jgi:hypothetical protein
VPQETFKGEAELRLAFAKDYPFYSEKILKVLAKGGGLVPFKLNKAQLHIHSLLEEQKRRRGKVRALVLKARQQGCSTYTAGRYYWNVTHRGGVNAFILSHAMDTTEKLFGITRRFYENTPKIFQQKTRAASAKELAFAGLESSYFVGTAGAKEVGRGGTIHYFHGSEVGFWQNTDMHFAGVMQSIPTGVDSKGTEVILESTANGPKGKFYEMCQQAMDGGEYQLIFTPWYWQMEYQDTPPIGWEWEKDLYYEQSKEAKEKYGLNMAQVYWMTMKRHELGSDWLFKQEYPAIPDEAFQRSGDEAWIRADLVLAAQVEKTDIVDLGDEPRIAALDPAGDSRNADRSALAHRCGRRIENVEYHKGLDSVKLAKVAKEYIEEHNIDVMFVDVGGLGVGVYDVLKHSGYGRIVKPCNFSWTPDDLNPDGTKKYLNKRAECWGRFKEWLQDKPCEIPNMSELFADITTPQYNYDKGCLQIESKRDIRMRGVSSPDGGDVCAMLFTEKISKRIKDFNLHKKRNYASVEYNELDFGLY